MKINRNKNKKKYAFIFWVCILICAIVGIIWVIITPAMNMRIMRSGNAPRIPAVQIMFKQYIIIFHFLIILVASHIVYTYDIILGENSKRNPQVRWIMLKVRNVFKFTSSFFVCYLLLGAPLVNYSSYCQKIVVIEGVQIPIACPIALLLSLLWVYYSIQRKKRKLKNDANTLTGQNETEVSDML